MEGMTLEKLQVIIEAQTKEYVEALNKVETETKQTVNVVEKQTSKIKSVFSKIGSIIAIALSVTAIVSFAKSCIGLGSDLIEVQNVVDVTFGEMSEDINEFASNAIEQFGLSELAAKQYSSTMGAMLKSMGFVTDEAVEMSTTMAGLAGDIASFYNLTGDEAFAKLRSGISGETEPLKVLGINLSVANLELFALEQGMTTAYDAMSEQEKALVRYNYILSVTSDAQGDFARTSDSWANQVRILTERFNSLKATIGQSLINLFTPVITVLNTLISKLQTAADVFLQFTELITGKTIGSTLSTTGTTDAVDSLVDATNDATDAATTAADAYSGLMGFDEINSLSKDSGSDSTSTAIDTGTITDSIGGITSVAEEVDNALSPILEKLKELKELFDLGFQVGLGDVNTDAIHNALDGIKESFNSIFSDDNVVKAANDYMDTLAYTLGQKVGALTSIGITIGSNVLGGIDKYLSENQEFIKTKLISILDISAQTQTIEGNYATAMAKIFAVFGGENGQQVTANIIGIFSNAALGIIEIFAKLNRDITNIIAFPVIMNEEELSLTLDGMLEDIANISGIVKTVVEDTIEKANEVYDDSLKPMFDGFASGFSTIMRTILDTYNTYFAPVIDELIEKLEIFSSEHLQPLIDTILEFIGIIATVITTLWKEIIVPFLDWIIANIVPMLATNLDEIGTTFLNLLAAVTDITNGIIETLGGIIEFVTGVLCGDWELAWQGIQDFLSGILELIKIAIALALSYIGIAWGASWTSMKTSVSTIFNNMWSTINSTLSTIKSGISTALSSAKTIWDTQWTSMKTSVVTIFDDMWSSIKGVINSILGGIETMANGVVSGVNTVINTLNNLQFEAPDWVPDIGGQVWEMSIPTLSSVSLPRLATGGVVSSPTAAIIGEAGAEAVVPLENNTGWMDKIANRLSELLIMDKSNSEESEWQNITTIVKLDSKTLVEQTEKYKKRKGYDLAPT